jgi:uncharacterized protein YbjT (DUF2867 family)
MKYVITGGAGHIAKPLTESLLSKGNEVTIVGRSLKNIQELVNKGAKAAIGSVEDVDFLTKTFTGADAVFTLVPPNMAATAWKKWIAQIGKNYAQAIKNAGVKYVVNLSSIGAHLPEGCGPVSGIHFVEKALNELTDVHIKHLRPASFYVNLFANIDMIKHAGIMGANFGGPDLKIILVHPTDIADIAAQELTDLNFSGQSIRYIASDEKTTDEIAKTIGTAIGKPDLKWIVFSDDDALKGMIQAGLPEEIAKNYAEMNHSIQAGEMFADYNKHHPEKLVKRKLEDFAKEFAAVYKSKEAVAVH